MREDCVGLCWGGRPRIPPVARSSSAPLTARYEFLLKERRYSDSLEATAVARSFLCGVRQIIPVRLTGEPVGGFDAETPR